jgi:single-strand DNA-binding protein
MGNYNRIILVGNLVRDPEIRYVQSGSPVTNLTIAVNRRAKQDDAVDYIDVVAWDKLAETSNTYKERHACPRRRPLVDSFLRIEKWRKTQGFRSRHLVHANADSRVGRWRRQLHRRRRARCSRTHVLTLAASAQGQNCW